MTEATYTVWDLARRAGVQPPTINRWVRHGLMPKVPHRGPATRYTAHHLKLTLAIARLAKTYRSHRRMRQVLAKMTPEQLDRAAGIAPPVAPPAPPSPHAGLPPHPPPPPLPDGHLGRYRGRIARAWEAIAIAPGLDLIVRDDADGEARRVAAEIAERYGR
ncbi:MAG: MerR family transcriptional regulator [Deltaproteobacteria bacterium]|nr:MerR family transcriptional regulator [Deltaproteobacteria bacterium]